MNRFFRLVADERIANRAEPNTPGTVSGFDDEAGPEEEPLVFPILERNVVEYVDYIDRPMPLLSDRVKRLVELYMPELRWRSVILTDMRRVRQEVYWMTSLPRLRCLSADSEFYRDGGLKRLVLEGKRNFRPLFEVDGIRERVWIVNLALAESLLRRDVYGIHFAEVEMDQ
ncbi:MULTISPECIES: serine protease [Paenibacillus]|uniref:Uncharacterized protein n=1 Tax=Paenibacillus albilobatus TaxID=2716884 RepID=A0A920C8R5_9BACL|nr:MULTISPECIES: serine protease [Paenibacillus]GIO29008.1 hypothetical protein J2TS6_01490 [Paenibacillus albilobatus]